MRGSQVDGTVYVNFNGFPPSSNISRNRGGMSPGESNFIHNTRSAWRVEMVLRSVT